MNRFLVLSLAIEVW